MPHTIPVCLSMYVFTQTILSLSLLSWPVAHLFLLSLSVSGPCLFCAHVRLWVPEILMWLCLVIMRTVDRGLKTKQKIVFILLPDCKRARSWHPAQTKTLAKKKVAPPKSRWRERNWKGGWHESPNDLQMNNAHGCITPTRRRWEKKATDWPWDPKSGTIKLDYYFLNGVFTSMFCAASCSCFYLS